MRGVVVARVRLEDEGRIRRAGVWTRAVVEIHRGEAFELARDDVVPPEFRIADEIRVELVRLSAAEIPAFSSRVAEDTGLGKQRPEVLHLIGRLVVRDQRRTWAAGTTIEPEKDQHLGAANVVVDVPPVRIADVRKAVGAAAVVSVRQSNRTRAVWRRKLEDALRFVRRKESEYLIAGEASPEDLRSGFLEKTARRRRLIERHAHVVNYDVPWRRRRIHPDGNRVARVGAERHCVLCVVSEIANDDRLQRDGLTIQAGADEASGPVGCRKESKRVRAGDRGDHYLVETAIEKLRRPARAVLPARMWLIRFGLCGDLTARVVGNPPRRSECWRDIVFKVAGLEQVGDRGDVHHEGASPFVVRGLQWT